MELLQIAVFRPSYHLNLHSFPKIQYNQPTFLMWEFSAAAHDDDHCMERRRE